MGTISLSKIRRELNGLDTSSAHFSYSLGYSPRLFSGATIDLMSKWTQFVLLAIIILIAAYFRLSDLDWDAFNHYHPDERYIAWVATTIEIKKDIVSELTPQTSTFNPFYWPAVDTTEGIVVEQDVPRKYAYGHLPLYLGVGMAKIAEEFGPFVLRFVPKDWSFSQDILNGAGRNEFRHITAVGRATTAIIDIASIVLLFLIGRLIFNPPTGLLAAALLSVAVLHIQLSRFFTVDPYLTFFVLLTLWFLILSYNEQIASKTRIVLLLAASISTGLAVGSKFGGILLLLPLFVAVFLQPHWKISRRFLLFVLSLIVGFLTFFLTNPFAILDATCRVDTPILFGPFEIPRFISQSCYLQNIVQQGTMVRGLRDVPFVRQYIGTIPYLYYLEMLFRWGLGPLLTIVSFIGLFWALWRFVQATIFWRQTRPEGENRWTLPAKIHFDQQKMPFTAGELILLVWAVPFLLTTGGLAVKFPRYLQPLIPILILFGAAMLLRIRREMIRRVAVATLLLLTSLFALAFVNSYGQPHPWIAASLWIYESLEPDSVIVNEMWDDGLPDNLFLNDENFRRSDYNLQEVNWLSGVGKNDSAEKLRQNLETIAAADFLVLSSNRNYGVIPRLSQHYPLSRQYYQLLFDGDLGYEVVYVGTRMPNLFGIYLKPDSFVWPGLVAPDTVDEFLTQIPGLNWGRFDESFTVYDQPLVIIFANKDRQTAFEMETLFITP